MRQDLIDRREDTFDLLIVKGLSYGRTVDLIMEKHGCKKTTIETDIGRMNEWLPRLIDETDHTMRNGLVRLKEIRKNRQELNRLAQMARSDKEYMKEASIRSRINDSLQLDLTLSQTLGLAERAPDKVDVTTREADRASADYILLDDDGEISAEVKVEAGE